MKLVSCCLYSYYCARRVKCFLSENLKDARERSKQEKASGLPAKVPKRFFGVVKPTESHPVPSSESMAPVPVPTTSGKKSLHLIPLGRLQGAVSAFTCYGSPLAVVEDRNQRRGLVSKLSICCSVCGKSSAITDPYQKRDLETNTNSVLAMRAIGKGRAGLETFCGMMGMLPPVSQRAYTTENQKLFVASGEEREASFADASAELRKDAPEDQVFDITVTCDGTWAR